MLLVTDGLLRSLSVELRLNWEMLMLAVDAADLSLHISTYHMWNLTILHTLATSQSIPMTTHEVSLIYSRSLITILVLPLAADNRICSPCMYHPSRRASPHFGRYSFPVPLRVVGWVGRCGWLHTEVLCPPEDTFITTLSLCMNCIKWSHLFTYMLVISAFDF